jgi:hypothetical protein
MEKTLEFKIECGEFTCASEHGKFCRFFGSIRYGLDAVCRLFPTKEESFTRLEVNEGSHMTGWTLRCEECLKNERK